MRIWGVATFAPPLRYIWHRQSTSEGRFDMEGLWSLITIVGPILLAAVLIFAYVRNRQQPKSEVDRSERGARELREQIDREDD